MEDKKKINTDVNKNSAASEPVAGEPTWVDEMKQELEDYIEEQGIYIRQ